MSDERLTEFVFAHNSLTISLTRPDLVVWQSGHRGGPASETLEEFSTRVFGCIEEIARGHLGSEAVVFTHSGVIDAAVRCFVGLPAAAPWTHDFVLMNGSITEIRFWPDGRCAGGAPRYAEIVRVGDTSHLAGELTEL